MIDAGEPSLEVDETLTESWQWSAGGVSRPWRLEGGRRVWYGINGGKVIEWRFVISLDEGRDKPTTVFWRDNEVGWTRSDGG